MRRRLATLAATSALALALGASPAMASPMLHMEIPYNYEESGVPVFPPIVCDAHTYTLTDGVFKWIGRDFSAAHFTAVNVEAVDEGGTTYRFVGGETYSDPGGRLTITLIFVSQGGGRADTIRVVGRATPAGTGFFFDWGTCPF